ncbi:MAG: TonB-dependent receptor [Ignavibacteriaceae bacterium]|nr:TonB-dependent receptor [Ignavibacteriaceae bacterium]NUM71923.1 TonB-dependent receptor [Ignavibacteriaceae bacterium]
MKQLIRLLFFLILIYGGEIAAQTGALRGFVTDSTNGESVIYANILVKGTNIGAATDIRGYYYLPGIPSGKQKITVSYIGYRTTEIEVVIYAGKINQVDVQLSPAKIELETISVTADKQVKPNETNLGLEQITIRQIQAIPAGIEADVLRALKTSPGVSGTSDITSRYYVRGGGSDQNVVLLNNAVLYNPFHALGLFSVIDPDMISVLEFYKGGFTSEYGGRISSVLNLVTRDGNKKSFSASAAASTLSAKFNLESPIPDGSVMITGRKSYRPEALDKFLNDKNAPFDFYDYSFKINYSNPKIYQNGKFTVHGFFSSDKVKNNDPFKEDYTFENQVYGLNWYQVWASPLFSHMSFTVSRFEGEVIPNNTATKPRKNSVSDFSSNWDFTYMFDSKDELQAGFHNKILSTELAQKNLFGSTTDIKIRGLDMALYVKYKYLRNDNLGIDFGTRLNLIQPSKRRSDLLEPRLSITYTPLAAFAVKASIGKYSQSVATLSNEQELISIFEPWVIIPDYLAPASATHAISGIDYYITDKIKFSAEGYYKWIDNLIDINELKFTSRDPDFISVSGKAYGVDVVLDVRYPDFYFKTSYSLAYTYKQKDGVDYFPKYDSRHSVNVLFGFQFLGGFQFNAVWQLTSGYPYTPIAGFFDKLQIDDFWRQTYIQSPWVGAYLFGAKNSYRLPVYHRLDMGLSRKFEIGPLKITADVSVINVYDRKNIFYYEKDTGEIVYMLPFLPSASLRIEI